MYTCNIHFGVVRFRQEKKRKKTFLLIVLIRKTFQRACLKDSKAEEIIDDVTVVAVGYIVCC